ncbi:NTPase [Algoriphagus sp. CAU 1675]|uniref:NTPase n=1 Tax=Algoriphagus sp. CAU 1675 TaxID=3032597 RepID=UPI0023DC703C|nr:NTPase [Algoriphagus sp. CAU 1675]MDF2156534.1 NTPase [Algoriphagus sp. CAU 1675]
MKYIFFLLLVSTGISAQAQGTIPESFFDGKSVVMISTDPGARPVMDWKVLADSVHQSLVQAGGDPIAYFELEQISLSEEVQADFATSFEQRGVKNIVLVTRQKSATSIHVGSFSRDGKILSTTALFGVSGGTWKEASEQFSNLGANVRTKNLLVIDVPEFPTQTTQANPTASQASQRFFARNPLNLEVFKLGIPLEGTSAQTGALSYFRYNMYGKSQETILAEQEAQKSQIQRILETEYPNEVAWLTEAKSNQELIRDRVQFLLVKVEGRESDLKRSMGLETDPANETQTVVKYYIKLLVRDELYIGPEWDADSDWRIALRNFLRNLKK